MGYNFTPQLSQENTPLSHHVTLNLAQHSSTSSICQEKKKITLYTLSLLTKAHLEGRISWRMI